MKLKKTHPSHKKVNLHGKVVEQDGKLKTKLNSPQLLEFFLKAHTKPGDELLIQVTSRRPKRSESQNNFFFLYLDLVSLSCGHAISELHTWVNEHILGQGITEVFGTQVRKVGHTSDLNISEFCEMMNRVFEETEIPIPDPTPFLLPLTYDEYGKLKLEQSERYSKLKNRLKDKELSTEST
jgi:hypothetical protein